MQHVSNTLESNAAVACEFNTAAARKLAARRHSRLLTQQFWRSSMACPRCEALS